MVLHISYLGCTGRASDRWRSPAASTLFTGAFQLHAICFRLPNTGGEFIQTSSIASSIGYIQVCIHLRNQGERNACSSSGRSSRVANDLVVGYLPNSVISRGRSLNSVLVAAGQYRWQSSPRTRWALYAPHEFPGLYSSGPNEGAFVRAGSNCCGLIFA